MVEKQANSMSDPESPEGLKQVGFVYDRRNENGKLTKNITDKNLPADMSGVVNVRGVYIDAQNNWYTQEYNLEEQKYYLKPTNQIPGFAIR